MSSRAAGSPPNLIGVTYHFTLPVKRSALLQENYVRAAALMHPKVIQYFGGREKAIAAFKSAAESTKAEGLVPTAARVAFPLGFGLAVLTASRSSHSRRRKVSGGQVELEGALH
jgi:hypothetical protein